jgi:hypothetical protein
MPQKGKGKPAHNTKVARMTFLTQAKSDYPQSEFADKGSKIFAKLQRQKKDNQKLTNYEEYLVLKHFPQQQQTLNKEQ